jgi:hypothetical protein
MFWSYSSSIQSWYWHISRSSDVVLPGDWLVSSVLFFCLPVELNLWGEVALPDHAGWSRILISSADGCVPSSCSSWSAPPPARCGSLVWNLPSESGVQLHSPLVVLWVEVAFCCACLLGFPGWRLIFLPCPLSLGQGQCSFIPLPSVVSVLWWFTVVFQFCGTVWLWVLLTGSEYELCDLLPALLRGAAFCSHTFGFPAFVYW